MGMEDAPSAAPPRPCLSEQAQLKLFSAMLGEGDMLSLTRISLFLSFMRAVEAKQLQTQATAR